MEYVLVGDEILAVVHVQTEAQVATVGAHQAWAVRIVAAYDGILRAEYRRPFIPGSEFSGQLVETETRPMLLRIDDSDPIGIPVNAGVAEVPLEFEAPGTYRVLVEASFPCEPAILDLEVTI